ncbi:MAG: esterase-like activity of phytase family protein, partial [Succinivibrio sp.]
TPSGVPFSQEMALAYAGEDGGSLLFLGLTDRGPNADGPMVRRGGREMSAKYFPSPAFNPEVGVIRLKDGKAEVIRTIPLKNADGSLITGLPIPHGIGSTGEAALDDASRPLGFDPNGLDPEGLAIAADGSMWISDEYGPFLSHFTKDGVLIEKLAPGEGIPEIFKHRTPNRGAEGVALMPDGRLAFMEQSVLSLKRDGRSSAKTASFCRIAIIDPLTHAVKTVGYPINSDYKKPGDAKLGDILALGSAQFLVIEQGKDRDGRMQNRIYKVDASRADDLTDARKDGLEPEFFKDAGGFKLARKTLLVDLRALGWDIEKAEGLAMLPDRRTLVVTNDNDFGLELKASDPRHAGTKIGKYELGGDGTWTLDGEKADVRLDFGRNDPKEQLQKLMIMRFEKPL